MYLQSRTAHGWCFKIDFLMTSEMFLNCGKENV